MVKKILPLLAVLAVSLFASWQFLTPGFIPTHDGEYHLIRFWQFDKMIKAGDFIPRWAPDLNFGFGVPLFNFFYPLPNYIGEFFHLLGFSFIDSFKLTLASGMIISGLFFYLWISSAFGSLPALVGSIFYVLAPYHLLDLYVRGTPGEIWALAWFPAILWSIERLLKTKDKLFIVLSSFFLALLFLSHNVLALIFLPFYLTYIIFLICTLPKKNRVSSIYYLILTTFLGFSLSAFFWLPAIFEAKYVSGLNFVNFTDHFPALFQLIFPSWGTGFSVAGIMDGMSFQIGLPHLLVVFISFFVWRQSSSGRFFLTCWIILVFLLLEISLPIWKLIPLMGLIQYPWRLLSLVIFLSSFIAGYLIFSTKSKLLAFSLVLLAILFYSGYTQPVKYAPRTDDFYLKNPDWTQGTTTLNNSFSTIWLAGKKIRPEKKLEIVTGKGEITKELLKPTEYIFNVQAWTPIEIKVNTAYFPGWKIVVNNKETPIIYTNGLINFKISPGNNIIKVKFTNTPIIFLANGVSLSGLFFLMILILKNII